MSALPPSPYSSRARVSLAIARAIAAARGERDVTPLHLALGLLREGENGAVAAMHHAGVPLRALRVELETALGPPPGGTRPDEVVVPVTPGERVIVARALAASRRAGDEYLGPEHLLLAILDDAADPASRALARHGITASSAPGHVAAVVHRCDGSHVPPAVPAAPVA